MESKSCHDCLFITSNECKRNKQSAPAPDLDRSPTRPSRGEGRGAEIATSRPEHHAAARPSGGYPSILSPISAGKRREDPGRLDS